MKTCLYCGGNNPDTASICMICGRDLHTGDHISRGNSLTSDAEKRAEARLALPRPESAYVNLLLLAPALVLFLLGLAVMFEPTMGSFYDLALPVVGNVGLVGGGLVLIALVMAFTAVIRTANALRVHSGYLMILREESGDEHPLIRCYNRYRERTTSMACLLWLIPVAFFVLLIGTVFLSSVAYYIIIGGTSITLPEVQDPIPYMALLLMGLIFLLIRFGLALRTTRTYRRYDKFLRGEDVGGFDNIRTGMSAALDAREFPQPETPYVYLLLLPAVLILFFFSLAVAVGSSATTFMGMQPPVFEHPVGAASLLILASFALAVAMFLCFFKQRAVTRGYYEALRMDEDTPFSENLEKYAHYQKQACEFYCLLWLLPVALFLGLMQLFYVSSYARYATILGQYRFILPHVQSPLPFVLLSVVAIIFLAILFSVTLHNTLAYRRSDLANRKRHREERERMEAEAAAAAEEEAIAAAAAEAEQQGLWGEYSASENEDTATEEPASEDPVSELDNFGVFLHTDEIVKEEPVVVPVYELDHLDPLERLRGVDAYDSAPVAVTARVGNLHSLCDRFVHFAKSNGYEPDVSSVRSLLAAMVTSRVVFIRPQDEASAKFAPNLSKFFGSNAPVAEVTGDWTDTDHLMFHTSFATKRATDSLCGLYRAIYAGDGICTLTLVGAENGSVDSYLKDLLTYSENPARANYMQLLDSPLSSHLLSVRVELRDGGVAMRLPENIWCLAISSDAKSFAAPASGFGTGSALTVSLRGKACEPVEAGAAEAGLSASELSRLVRGLPEHYFLPEEQWKKFDRVEEFLQARAGVRFDNRLMRRLENFSSAYLAVDNDANQILDAMLEAVFLPMIAELDHAALGSIDGSAGICETMALAFGADNIPYCMQALHELGFEA